MIKIKIFKILSIFLMYPSLFLKDNIDSILNFVKEEKILQEEDVIKLSYFIDYIKDNNITLLQENYVSIFDRQKNFSLYLFEHIHGDSRERGMAMIDLQNLYKNYNFDINKHNELPDYIPLFLEFISLIPNQEAYMMLSEIINLISIIGKRLEIIQSPYFFIFSTIESLSSIKPDKLIVEKSINKEFLTKNNFDIDNEWEEKKIF